MSVESLIDVKEIENAVMSVSNHLTNKSEKVNTWRELSEEELWYYLVSCILGSRVNYETANACAFYLYQAGLLVPLDIVANPDEFEKKIEYELSKPIFPPFNGSKGRRYRYYKSKSNYIVRTAIKIYKDNSKNLKDLLTCCQNEYVARDTLKNIAIGIGYKQASLFLRNISYSKNLAILDSHVTKYMVLLNMVENDKNFRISNNDEYIKLEKTLQKYAVSNSKSIATLDIAIWIVMRLIQREYRIWQ